MHFVRMVWNGIGILHAVLFLFLFGLRIVLSFLLVGVVVFVLSFRS